MACPGGPALGFQRVDDPTPGMDRLHPDFHAADMEGEVAGLVGLGSRETGCNSFHGDFHQMVFADPAGNAFCVAGG